MPLIFHGRFGRTALLLRLESVLLQRRLLLPESSRRSVRKVLERCLKNKDNPSFDAGSRAAGSGRRSRVRVGLRMFGC